MLEPEADAEKLVKLESSSNGTQFDHWELAECQLTKKNISIVTFWASFHDRYLTLFNFFDAKF